LKRIIFWYFSSDVAPPLGTLGAVRGLETGFAGEATSFKIEVRFVIDLGFRGWPM